jgi:hypothetical protein
LSSESAVGPAGPTAPTAATSGHPDTNRHSTTATSDRKTIIDAVFGPTSAGEAGYTRSPRVGMIVLLDRDLDDGPLLVASPPPEPTYQILRLAMADATDTRHRPRPSQLRHHPSNCLSGCR